MIDLKDPDMKEIVEKTIELEKDLFTFDINEDGIEVDIQAASFLRSLSHSGETCQ